MSDPVIPPPTRHTIRERRVTEAIDLTCGAGQVELTLVTACDRVEFILSPDVALAIGSDLILKAMAMGANRDQQGASSIAVGE